MVSLPISLPDGFSPVVTVGDPIKVGETIAQKKIFNEDVINIPAELSVSVKKAKKLLTKKPGDPVQEQEIIAVKHGFLGFGRRLLRSRITGTVSRYERDTGHLVIQTSYEPLTENLVSPVDGTVALCDNEKIVINTDKNILMGTRGSGTTGDGELFILESSLNNEENYENANLLYFLDNRAVGKVIVGGCLPREVLVKGVGIGAKGIIGTRIADEDIAYLMQRRLSVPIIEIDPETVKKLQQWKGKKIFLDGDSKSIVLLQL